MPSDVSFTSGQRSSRSSRTQTAPIDTGGISIRNRDFERVADVAQPLDYRGLTDRIGQFFGQAQKLDEVNFQEQLVEIKRQNTDKIIELQTAVRKDPEGARAAIASGDYSKFTGSLGDRRVVADAFQIATAGSMAAEDLPELTQAVENLSDEQDPRVFVDQWLNEKLKGAPGLFGAAYADAIGPTAQRAVAVLQAERVERQKSKALEAASGAMTAHFRNGGGATQEDLIALRRSFIAGLPVQGPAAVLEGEARFEDELVGLAASGDNRALQMLTTPDPERDGISWADRNPEEFAATQQAHLRALRQVRSLEEQEFLDGIELGIRTGDLSRTAANAQMWRWAEHHGRTKNMSDRMLGLFGEDPVAADNGEADVAALLMATDQGLVPQLGSINEQNKAVTRVFGAAMAGDESVTPDRVGRMLAMTGGSSETRSFFSRIYQTGGRAEQFDRAHAYARAAITARPGGRYADYMDAEAAALAEAIDVVADEQKVTPSQARALMLEGDDPGVPPAQYLAGLSRDPGDPDAKQYGSAGAQELAAEAFNNSDMGLIEPGILDDEEVAFSGLSLALQQEFTRVLSTHLWVQHRRGQPIDIKAAQEATIRTMQNRVAWGANADGTLFATQDRTPPWERSPEGRYERGHKITAKEMKEAVTAANASPIAGYMSRDGVSLVPDDITELDASYGVRSAGGAPVAFLPGQAFNFPREEFEAHGDLGGLLEVVSKTETEVRLRVREPGELVSPGAREIVNVATGERRPGPGMSLNVKTGELTPKPSKKIPERIMVGDNMGFVYDTVNRVWRARYFVPHTEKKKFTGADLDAARAAEVSTPAMREAIADDEQFPVSEDVQAARDDFRRQAIRDAQQVLGASETATRVVRKASSAGTTVEEVHSRMTDAMLDEGQLPKGPDGTPGDRRFVDLASEVMGLAMVPYAADTRRSLPGSGLLGKNKDKAIIGFGLSLGRPDALELLRSVGVERPEIMPVVSRAQAEKLSQLAMKKDLPALRKEIPAGARLRTHQLTALLLVMQASPRGLPAGVRQALRSNGDVAGAIRGSFPQGRAPQLLAERLAVLYRGG
jgi:hypothetical protein